MEQINKDLLIKIALLLDMEDILQLCNSSTKINKLICKNDNFWEQKLLHDYDIYSYEVPKNVSHKDYYNHVTNESILGIMHLRKIKLLKQKLKLSISLLDMGLSEAFRMNWQEAVELLIDSGADIRNVNFTLMNDLIPNFARRCQKKISNNSNSSRIR